MTGRSALSSSPTKSSVSSTRSLDLGLGTPEEKASREVQRLAGAHVVPKAGLLGQIPDAAADGKAVADDILAKDRAAAARRANETQEQFHRRRLAGAVGTQEAKDRVPGHA